MSTAPVPPARWSPPGTDGAGGSGPASFPVGLMAGLLPETVSVVDALDSSFDGDRLVHPLPGRRGAAFDAEVRALGGAGPLRRTEFSRARICAHAAVTALGRRPEAILIGGHREPRWPAGLAGSITHCTGYRAAAVADARVVLAVGIDAESDRALPDGIAALALTAQDRARSANLARFRHWDCLAFSARESVFKAWFAVTGCRLDFADATLSLQPDGPLDGEFAATIAPGVPGSHDLLLAAGTAVLHGRYRWVPGPSSRVLTAVTLRHRVAGPAAPGEVGLAGSGPSPRVAHE